MLTNAQIAAARDVIDRYTGSGRVLTHTIVHPNFGAHELDAMEEWSRRLRPSGWKVYTLYGPPTKASPGGGWFLDDDEIGMPFLGRVDALGPRVVAAHKGLGGPIPEQSVAAASPRDIGPAATAFPGIKFVVYHSGYERDPDGREGGSSRASRRPASGPAATSTPSSAAPGSSCSGARWKPRTCSASCSRHSVRIGSCGEPTRRGTDHRNR